MLRDRPLDVGQPVPVHLEVGPVAASSARSWIANARVVLAGVRAAGESLPVDLPVEVERAFIGYLDQWEAVAASTDPFVWSADVDVEHARLLVVYFFSVLRLDDEVWEAHGLPFAPPEAEPFFDALSTAVIEALAAADTEVGPSIKASWPADTRRPARPPQPGGLLRVVVVDDTEDVRLLLGMTLNIDGRFELVGEAVDGREGIDVCRSTQPDGILLDMMMPVLDGLEALPEIRASCPRARIVMLSANDNPELVDRALALGADAFVTKGSSLDEALEALLG